MSKLHYSHPTTRYADTNAANLNLNNPRYHHVGNNDVLTDRDFLTAPVEIFRSDCKPSDFYVSDTYMSFQLDTHESIVTTTSQMTRSISPASKGADLILDGEDLDLIDVKIAGVLIAPEIYKYEDGKLRIPSTALPSDIFELQTSVRLKPDQNLALSGLYKSGTHLRPSRSQRN